MNRRNFFKNLLIGILSFSLLPELKNVFKYGSIGKWTGPYNWFKYKTKNLDTNKMIHWCFQSNDITGEYWVYKLNNKGSPYIINHEVVIEKRIGRLKIIPPGQW